MLPIVIVDDSREDALLALRALQHCKVQNPISLLNSGRACLDYFGALPPFSERSLPCLLLLDMVMPPLNGLEVLRELQGMPEARTSVIVMASGLAEWRIINEGYRLGANTYLVKPLCVDDMMQMLNSIPALSISKVPGGYEIVLSHSGLDRSKRESIRRDTPATPSIPGI